MGVAFNPGRKAVTRNVRLPREMDSALKRLVEAKASSLRLERRSAIAAYIEVHA